MSELKTTINELLIDNALLKSEIQQLTFLVFELLHRVEQKDDVTTLKIDYANTLLREKTDQLDKLGDAFQDIPLDKIVSEKFAVEDYYNSLIKMLENS